MHRDTPRHLRYASGYLQLNMLDDAAVELEAIAPEDRMKAPVLTMRADLLMALKEWSALIEASRELAREKPDEERAWIYWAYALRELNRVAEARAVLLEAEPLHGATSAVLHYNLACYACLLGELETARERLTRACKMEPAFQEEAEEDPDLAGLARP